MKTTSEKSKRLFFSGALVLTLANILVKVIGLTLKIPLQRLLGDEGMGYYSAAYDIYIWLYMISTAGLPVAVSLMISENRAKGNIREAKKILRITVILFVIIGLAGMGIMLGGANWFAKLYKLEASNLCILAVAPTLFFICIASALRGYFQGYQNMFPTAISQIIEALGKLVIGILFAVYALARGYELYQVAAFTILGLTIGVAAGTLYLVISKLMFKASKYDEEYITPDSETMTVRTNRQILKALIWTAVPITLSASIMSLTNVFDGIIISRQLQSLGYTEKAASAMFGNYKTLAVSLYNLPPALIYPVSYSIVPLLSASIAIRPKEDVRLIMNGALKIAALIAIPCSLGLSVLAEPILKLLFPDASAVIAAPLLSVLAPSVFFVGMLAISNSILQAHKYERKPIISMIAGSAVKLVTSYILIGIPGVEMFGAPIGTFLCYLTIVLFNFGFMAKYIGFVPDLKNVLLRPFAASVICAFSAIGSFRLLKTVIGESVGTLAAIAIAAVVYALMVFLIKAITRDDIMLLPKGEKICRLLEKAHLLKG